MCSLHHMYAATRYAAFSLAGLAAPVCIDICQTAVRIALPTAHVTVHGNGCQQWQGAPVWVHVPCALQAQNVAEPLLLRAHA